MGEFDLIKQYFPAINNSSVDLGIGDDCALLTIPDGQQLAITTDTLIAGRHFPHQTRAEDIAYKAITVSLSDLAAMGAQPKWISLALSLPSIDQTWLAGFSRGLFDTLSTYQLHLIGGDTTCGELSLTVTAQGLLPRGSALKRSGAQVGDAIYVSGFVGDAGLALSNLSNCTGGQQTYLQECLDRPIPRIDLGITLREFATSAIDISDGLAQDLQHVLTASGVGAMIDLRKLPLSPVLEQFSRKITYPLALTAGDDYELCFTLAEKDAYRIPASTCTRIGTIIEDTGLHITPNAYQHLAKQGYSHF